MPSPALSQDALARRRLVPAALAVTAAGLVAASGFLVASHGTADDARAHAPRPAPLPPGVVQLPADQLGYLGTDTVRARHERVVATLPAQLVWDEGHTVRVASPVVGRVLALLAQPGDRVSAGQPLARIASSDLSSAESDLAKADAAAALTGAALTRARDLYAHGVIAQKDLEQARSDAATAAAERARAGERVHLLGGRSSDPAADSFLLRAPIAGTVVDRTINPGQEVRPDNGQTLFTVTGTADLWLVANAYQRELADVRSGETMRFTSEAMPGQEVRAAVTYVSGTLDPQTRTATVRAVVPNVGGALRAQTFGQAELLADDPNALPAVPSLALVTHGAQTVVYLADGPGRFRRQPVQVQSDDGRTATVAAGLKPGDVVVTRGSILLDAEAAKGPAAGGGE